MRRGFTTAAVHAAAEALSAAAGVAQTPASTPIYQTSTWRFSSNAEFADVLDGKAPGYVYGRGYGNPTVDAFEAVMAELEGTEAAFAYSSGMSAIHAVCVALAGTGDRIVVSRELYGGTYALFSTVLPRYGITVDEVDCHDLDAVSAALDGAAMFYCETIANPLCTVADLVALGELCRTAGVASVVDNTFASPYLCNPASHGFDYVVHSATKSIAGHSDVLAGVVCCSAADRERLRGVSLDVGGAQPPFESWLCLRGVETLELRMERACVNAAALAELLSAHVGDGIAAVHYPGLASHPHHERAKGLFRTGLFGSMIGFEVEGGLEAASRLCERLEIAWIAASLGGTHTLVCHPATTTHRQVPAELRRATGLSDGFIRLSAGIENLDDLLGDFARALQV